MRQLKSTHYMKEDFPFWIQHQIHQDESESMHKHDFIELVYVVKGQAQHYFEDTSYPIQAGDVFIINPGEVHGYKVEPGSKLDIINCLFWPSLIHDTLLHELGISQSIDYFYVHPFLDNDERFHHRLNLVGQEAGVTLALLENMIDENQSRRPGYLVIIRLQMIQLLILLSRHYSLQKSGNTVGPLHKNKLLVQRICGYLERNYDQKVTLTSLSELFSISVRQLNRLFKQEVGHSVLDTLHRIRVDEAKRMLIETDEKVITIASAVGYDDPAFFSQLFVRYVGCPPGKYRSRK